MFTRIGTITTRHPVAVVVVWITAVVVAGMAILSGFGLGGLFERMGSDGFTISDSESQIVQELTTTDADAGETTLIVVTGIDLTDANEFQQIQALANQNRSLFESENVDTVIDAFSSNVLIAENIGQELTDSLAEEMIAQAVEEQVADRQAELTASAQTPADLANIQAELTEYAEEVTNTETERVTELMQALAMVAQDGSGYAISVTLASDLDDDTADAAQTDLEIAISQYQDALRTENTDANVYGYSATLLEQSIMEQVQHDLVIGESIGLPVAAIIMVIVFAGIIAAFLPLIGALGAIILGMVVLWLATLCTSVDTFTLNVASIVGVALSVDYGLLIVSRFREEAGISASKLHVSLTKSDVKPIVERTVATAGRTVAFSAITIAFALTGLMFLGVHTMRVISLATVCVTLLSLAAAITLVPALLTLVGHRLLRPSVLTKIPGLRKIIAAVGDSSSSSGVFSRIANWVQKRPWRTIVGCLIFLVVASLPLIQFQVRNNFVDYIAAGSDLDLAYQTIQQQYPQLATSSITVVVDAPTEAGSVSEMAEEIQGMDGVLSVTTSALPTNEQQSQLDIQIDTDDEVSQAVTSVVEQIRDLDIGVQTWTGGAAASQIDFLNALLEHLPEALTFMIIAVMVLLFLMTGSILVPIKALLINSLSLCASIGVTSFLFQHGIGVPQTAGLELFIVACMVAFGFGLAMDYEVFLLARVKEFWDDGWNNEQAVTKGMQRSGRVITSAAAIIVAVFVGFSFGDLIPIKEIGVALAIMVIADATIVRMLLVPATMTVLGRWNWWAPKWLTKIHQKLGLHE